ncbi:hypothetical protein SISNIDRAFT_486520 [Sistotremastrum niveocremeum HHB9708]|uniref:Mediator of RNA polymerase II transcription subunit 25 von Willebrand factor type A domain-containing protein n=2 Tax=Sistotremastraceae TaxID=3402574 RepID=A0A164TMF2_9AGAM|nr:hypothetical protein SISNIDRAFT_486520 [Sistotremastrum niveocremeum HHB9708]KZT42155.1 hypothetical protein SISSUDRAFT_1058768 [Sistotremastrum suecicum HHB10207 ss-3]
MSQPQQPQQQDSIAVACVIESSTTLAKHWTTMLTQYFPPIMTHIASSFSLPASGSPHSQAAINEKLQLFRIAIITYGSADTRPSPVIAKRFFGPPHIVTRQLKDEREYGIGMSPPDPRNGMAALEGIVAALELFDTLFTQSLNKPSACHIFLFASNPPNAATRPMWNGNQNLDDVSWDTLPEEFQKRKIRFSIILSEPIPKLQEFWSKSAISPNNAWFPMQQGHVVQLDGVQSHPQQSPAPNNKRSIAAVASPEVPPERHQKPKQEPSSASPKQSQSTSTPTSQSQSSQPRQPTPNQSQTQVQSQTTPLPSSQSSQSQPSQNDATPQTNGESSATQSELGQKVNEIFKQFKALETEIRQSLVRLAAGRQQGAPNALVTTLQQELRPKIRTYEAMRNSLNDQRHRSVLTALGLLQPGQVVESCLPPQKRAPVPPSSVAPSQSQSQSSSEAPTPAVTVSNPPTSQPAAAAMFQTRSLEMESQMAKLVASSGGGSVGLPPVPTVPLPGAQESSTPASQPPFTWFGRLMWAGADPGTKQRKEMSALVKARNTDPSRDCGMAKWPPQFSLVPARRNGLAEVLGWVRKSGATICHFVPHGDSPEELANSQNYYTMLRMLLISKSVCAVSQYSVQEDDGTTSPFDVLIFPGPQSNPEGLYGAITPMNRAKGEPLQPTPGGPLAPAVPLPNMSAAMTAQQIALTQQYFQTAGRPPGAGGAGFNLAQFLNNTGNTASPALSTGSHGSVSHQRTPSGGGFSLNLPPEAMQSFLQRSQDGTGS